MAFRPVRFIPDDTKIPFMRLSRFGFFVSGLLCLASLRLFIFVGLNVGVDFKGGSVITIRTEQAADLDQLRSTLDGLGLILQRTGFLRTGRSHTKVFRREVCEQRFATRFRELVLNTPGLQQIHSLLGLSKGANGLPVCIEQRETACCLSTITAFCPKNRVESSVARAEARYSAIAGIALRARA